MRWVHPLRLSVLVLYQHPHDGWLMMTVVFFQKYVYGIKTLIPLAMGLTKYSSVKFTIFNILATILWAAIVGYLSFTAGEYILNMADDFKYIGIGIVIVVLLLISYIFKRIEK